jgi:hypothetical protein
MLRITINILIILYYISKIFAVENNNEFVVYMSLFPSSSKSSIPDKILDINNIILESIPIISEKDIISFNPDRYKLEITSQCYNRISVLLYSQSKPVRLKNTYNSLFIACIGDKRLFYGYFMSPLSSYRHFNNFDWILYPPMKGKYLLYGYCTLPSENNSSLITKRFKKLNKLVISSTETFKGSKLDK